MHPRCRASTDRRIPARWRAQAQRCSYARPDRLPLRAATYLVNATPAGSTSALAQTQAQAPQAQSYHAFSHFLSLDYSALRDLFCTDAPPLLASSLVFLTLTLASIATPHGELCTGTLVTTVYVHSTESGARHR